MSPCTAKLSAFRSKQVGKYVHPIAFPYLHSPLSRRSPRLICDLYRVKPKSLFAQASAKKLGAGNSNTNANGAGLFGSKPAQGNNTNPFGSN